MSSITPYFQLCSEYQAAGDQPAAIARLVQGVETGLDPQVLLGVTGSGKTFTMAHVIAKMNKPALILAPNKTLAAQLYAEMRAFFPKNAVEYFVSYYDYYQPEAYVPSTDTFIEKDSAINEQIEQLRLSATRAILERRDTIIVATVSAIYGLGDPNAYLSMVLPLQVGMQVNQREFLRQLATLQYTRNDIDFRRGTYRVRGDIIDIFPAESDNIAVRVDLFDDVIDNMLKIDPLTGEILESIQALTIFPKTHYVTPKAKIMGMIEAIKTELADRLQYFYQENKLVEAQRLQQRIQFDIEMMIELGYCSGIENYSRYLSGRAAGEPPPTLLDYFPTDGLLILDESHVMLPQLAAMSRGDRARKENLVGYGFRLPSALDNRPLTFDEFIARAPQMLFVSATPADYEKNASQQTVEQIVRPTGLLDPVVEVRPVASQVDDILTEIRACMAKNERVLITTLTKRMAEDLTEYLASHAVAVRYLHSDIDTIERIEIIRELRLGIIQVLVGINLLREGLDIPEVALIGILDADKAGFLRSERSLIQTIGRAARNVSGRAILYADSITAAMQRAMDETARRRKKQAAFNKKHGITPQSIKKNVANTLEAFENAEKNVQPVLQMKADLDQKQLTDPKKIARYLKQLEKEMHAAAKDLDFEMAAKRRDQIQVLKKLLME